MRCYYDQQIFMSQANGGISRYFFELVQRLGATGGFEPTVFAGFYRSQLPLGSLMHCRVIGVRRRFKVGPLWSWALRLCDATNRRLLRGLAPAIYHPTYYHLTPRPRGTRLVVTVYDMIHEKFPQYYPAEDPTAELKRAACLAADAVICISDSTRRDLLGYYPEIEAKTSVVHLAVAADFGQAVPDFAQSTGEPPYALFVGSRQGYKGFDLALDAWAQLRRTAPGLRLVCVGGGEFSASEIAAITSRNLEAKVNQRNASDEKLSALYRGASLFICPSRYEGFGLPILEAMACGCPVVCSRSSSLPEVGGEAAAYFKPGDAADLAAKVALVVGDEAYRTCLVNAGEEQRRKFSWDQCARQTAVIYRGCVRAGEVGG